jgi:hypothetical protein
MLCVGAWASAYARTSATAGKPVPALRQASTPARSCPTVRSDSVRQYTPTSSLVRAYRHTWAVSASNLTKAGLSVRVTGCRTQSQGADSQGRPEEQAHEEIGEMMPHVLLLRGLQRLQLALHTCQRQPVAIALGFDASQPYVHLAQ